jgi:hypothetical protein
MLQQVSTAGFWNGKVQNVVIYACCILCFFCFWLLLFITSDLKLFSYIVQVKAIFKQFFCTCYNMYDLILYMLLHITLNFRHLHLPDLQFPFLHWQCTKPCPLYHKTSIKRRAYKTGKLLSIELAPQSQNHWFIFTSF